MAAAKAAGRKVAFDIDYRPNLWGLAGHGAGEERFVRSEAVTEHLHGILPACDLVVGTEEELHVAGGTQDTLAALRAIRARLGRASSSASAGRWAARPFPAPSPTGWRTACRGPASRSRSTTCSAPATPSWPGSCAAGSGARGWSRPAPTPTPAAPSPCRACSARPSIRPGTSCSISSGSAARPVRSAATRRSTTSTGRRPAGPARRRSRRSPSTIGRSWRRSPTGSARSGRRSTPSSDSRFELRRTVASGREGFGVLLDGTYGREALFDAAEHPFWIGRPVEKPGSRPLAFEASGPRLAPRRMARRPDGQGLVLLPPRRLPGAEGTAGGGAARRARCLPRHRPRAPDRDHRRKARRPRRGHGRRRDRASLPARRQAGLVEAGAAGERGRLDEDRARHRGGRPVLPRRGDARPGRPGGGASARPSRRRPASASSRGSRSGARSSRTPPSAGSRAACPTRTPSPR